jgi:hypothetical protein
MGFADQFVMHRLIYKLINRLDAGATLARRYLDAGATLACSKYYI